MANSATPMRASERIGVQAAKVYRHSVRIADEDLQDWALLSRTQWRRDGAVEPLPYLRPAITPLFGPMMEFFWIPHDARARRETGARETWLPDLQVLFAREQTAKDSGLYFAAKGGPNAENDNHNDSDQFIIGRDRAPVIIDLGRETYTAQVFGSGSYELLFTRGLGHNAPSSTGSNRATTTG